MKILLGVDGSPCSDAAAEEIATRIWPAGSEVKILSVIEPVLEPMTQPWTLPENYYQQMEDFAESHAQQSAIKAAERLKTAETKDLQVTTAILKGFPKEILVDEADSWGADLIVVGSHGYHGLTRFLLGSVSQAVASHANCSVEIVRCRQSPTATTKSHK